MTAVARARTAILRQPSPNGPAPSGLGNVLILGRSGTTNLGELGPRIASC